MPRGAVAARFSLQSAHATYSAAVSGNTTGLRAAALLLASSTMLSRILGYGRDFLLNSMYGATGATDVYRASFSVPDALNYMLAGGALTITLLPRMAELYAKHTGADGRSKEVDEAFSIVASTMLTAMIVLVVIAEIFTEPFVALQAQGFSPEKLAQTVRLTRIVLPAQIFFMVGGLVQANLLARQRFGALAVTPILYNGGIVIGGVIGAQWDAIEGFSWGALIGAFFGGFVVPVFVARTQLTFIPKPPSLHKEVRSYLWIALPLMLGVGLTTVDEWVGRYFGSFMEEGSISWLETARRLMMVPVGLVGAAAGNATGSYVARLYAEGNRAELSDLLTRTVSGVSAIALVVSGFTMAMAEPIVGVLFEHGRFGADDTARAAAALVPLSAGIAAWATHHVVARSLYATGDTWRPMLLTTGATALAVPMYIALAKYGIVGLAVAGTIGITVQVSAMSWLASVRLGLRGKEVAASLARGIAVAAVAGGAAALVDHFTRAPIVAMIPAPSIAYLLRLLAAGPAWLVVVAAAGTLLHLPGLDAVVSRVRNRLKSR